MTGPKTKHLKILLAESNTADGDTIAALCTGSEKLAADVHRVTTLAECVKVLSTSAFDVILLNVSLSDSQGFVTFLRVKEKSSHHPIIILADKDDDGLQSRTVGAGAQDFLVKTLLGEELLVHAINCSLDRYRTYMQLQEKLQDFQTNEGRFLNVIVNNADGIVVVDKRGLIRFVNPASEQIFRRPSASLVGSLFGYRLPVGESAEFVIGERDGAPVHVEMRAVETEWEGEHATLVSIRDNSLRIKAEQALRDSEERYALALRGSRDGLWDWDLVNQCIYFSVQWKEMLGYSEDEVTGSPEEWFARIHDEDREDVRAGITRHLNNETNTFEREFRMHHKDGTWRWIYCRGAAVRDAEGKASRIAGSQTDITPRKTAEKGLKQALNDLQFALASEKILMEELDRKNRELMELSITDGLTGLFNHRFLQERFEFEFKRVKRYGGTLSCMMIDIDHFKMVNDTWGHQFGDIVLREISGIIKSNSRDVDICGRYGGEEFMVISNQSCESAMKHATKLHACVDKHPFSFEGRPVHITVSIGVSEFRPDVASRTELVERADSALYDAKDGGRNLIRLWKEKEGDERDSLDKYGIADLKTKFQHLSNQMRAMYMDATNALIHAVEAKDPYTQKHAEKVSAYAVKLAQRMGMSEYDIETVKYAGLLHDVGKVGVRPEILVKTDPLTDAEFELLKKHPVIGVSILRDIKFLEKEIPLVQHHHERYDGTGYPQRLKGREIPVGARILAVADAFEAMTAGRMYRERKMMDVVIGELEKGKGTQFDPELVDLFVAVLRDEEKESGHGENSPGTN